ncbi:hypothetical protein MWN52_08495 [Pseudoxanthomonas winnipegensis]|uniref:hypothetical protein n=1 Tax=Pseudoxanthomonas winnipegensis TaxID=2480810 RepID=UPI00257909C4|nr:hypothetical protein [Pseudoxanthomonas winnipegensis]WJI17261.1 hypothetical protein MWN52_08495 [Pseudoxanthomonas winnipegensis]
MSLLTRLRRFLAPENRRKMEISPVSTLLRARQDAGFRDFGPSRRNQLGAARVTGRLGRDFGIIPMAGGKLP